METTAHRIEAKERTSDVKLSEKVPFNKMLLSAGVRKGLHRAGYVYPTVLQANAIPIGKAGIDLIVQSKSGTGKTLIFTVVLLEAITESPAMHPQALILVPTREIAVQIESTVNVLGSCCPGFKAVSVIGGLDFAADRKKIQHARAIVGTPGRVLHLIQNDVFNTSEIKLLVLDEADKMIASTFRGDFEKIYNSLPSKKQMIACSATFCNELDNVLAKYMRNPFLISTEKRTTSLLGIKQLIYTLAEEKTNILEMQTKVAAVCQIFSHVPFKQCLVFSNSQSRAESYRSFFCKEGWPSDVISGAQDQLTRIEVFHRFREYKTRILVATDLMARGIDSENVNLVINLELPDDGATYLHRIGRAGRFGSHGIAISFIASKKDREKLRKLLEKIGFAMELLKFPKDRIVDLWNFQDPEEERVRLGIFDINENIEYEKENINNNWQNETAPVIGSESGLKRQSLAKEVKREVLKHLIDPKSPTKSQVNRNGNLFSDFIEEINSEVNELIEHEEEHRKQSVSSINTETCTEPINVATFSIDDPSQLRESSVVSLKSLTCDESEAESHKSEAHLFDDFVEVIESKSLAESPSKDDNECDSLAEDERQAQKEDEEPIGLNDDHITKKADEKAPIISETLKKSLSSLLLETKPNQKIADLFDEFENFKDATLEVEVSASVHFEKTPESKSDTNCKAIAEVKLPKAGKLKEAKRAKKAVKEAIREVHKSIVSKSDSPVQIESLKSFSEPQPSTSMLPLGPSSNNSETSNYPNNSVHTSADQTNHDLVNMSSLTEDAEESFTATGCKNPNTTKADSTTAEARAVERRSESLSSEATDSSADLDSTTETAPEQYESSGFDEEISAASSGVVTTETSSNSYSSSSDPNFSATGSGSSADGTLSYESSSASDSDVAGADKKATGKLRNCMREPSGRNRNRKYKNAFSNWTQLYWEHMSQIQDYVNFYKYAEQQASKYS